MHAANAPTTAPNAAPNGASTNPNRNFSGHTMSESHMQTNAPIKPNSIGTTTKITGVNRSKRKSFVIVKQSLAEPNYPPGQKKIGLPPKWLPKGM